MAAKHDTETPLERVERLLVELGTSKLRQSDAYTDVRVQEKAVDDARHRVRYLMAHGAEKYRARDPEVIRVELAIALHAIGVEYPRPDE